MKHKVEKLSVEECAEGIRLLLQRAGLENCLITANDGEDIGMTFARGDANHVAQGLAEAIQDHPDGPLVPIFEAAIKHGTGICCASCGVSMPSGELQ